MSDLIDRLREGVRLRFNKTPIQDFITMCQQAADTIESQARRIAELEGLLMVERSWNERHRVRMMQIVELEAERDAANSRIELLESDMKSGDYESLYGQAVQQLSDATEAQQIIGMKMLESDKARLELEAENAKLRVDAGRYQWLRDVGDAAWEPMSKRVREGAAGIDAAIDAARKEQQ